MKCKRCQVNKNEIEFIKDGILFKNCNKCRKNTRNARIDKENGIIPKKLIFRKERLEAISRGNFICSTCKLEKPLSLFPKNVTSLKISDCSGTCKDCIKFRGKYSKIKTQYGLTKEQFIKLIENQKGNCKICNIPMETFSFKNNKANTLCIDHCHITNTYRGMLCNNCNRALGLFKDNSNILLSAYNYLLAHRKSDKLLENPEKDNQQPI